MKNKLQPVLTTLQRSMAMFLAVGLLMVSVSGVAFAAAAGGQVQYRSIKMSDNGVSGGTITSGVGSGTNVTYRVTFRAATSYDIKGIILDFCSGKGAPTNTVPGTPFIGDPSCPAPADFTVGTTPTVDTSNYTYGAPATTVTGLGTTSDWTADALYSGQTLRMVNSTATAVSLTAGTDYTFAVSGVTNTSELGTFYARLITYTSSNGDITSYTHGSPGAYQDYGGFALSTAAIVQVTAKVQETIAFCVSGTTDTAPYPATAAVAPTDCTQATPPAIILGHGDNNTLDSSQVDKNTVWTIASTNALRGITIRMHNSNQCGGLSTDNGTTCAIPAVGPSTPGTITPGVAMFGMFCYDSTGASTTPSPVGTILCDPNYRDAAHTTFPADIYFGMDNTTLDDNVSSTFGDTVAGSTAPVSNLLNQYDFAATASNTTPAGIYKANLAMIATGTF